MTEPIPGPPGLPIVGNLFDLQDDVPVYAIERLIDIYGPMVKATVFGREVIAVGSFELFDELCDETRFYKLVLGALAPPKPGTTVGLFTSQSEKEPDWIQAHRILMPAFGPLAIEQMFDEMFDIASQMVLYWARQGPEHKIHVTRDMSRLTLDTIALCAMDYRFNSFYQEEPHPFVQAMNRGFAARNARGQIGGMLKSLLPSYNERIRKDVEFQKQVSRDLVKLRRDNPTEKKDLLNSMINGKDPTTGEGMRDDLIVANMQTFLVAGHETTSGLLSFVLLQLLKNPSAYFAAQQEVDQVLGKERIQTKHLNQLHYLTAVLRETLRLTPTAPGFGRGVRPENKEEHPTIGGGRYEVPRGKPILCLVGKIQKDPKVWGDDAADFKPERMLDEHFNKLPKNAWKPFGTGLRACIGRAFAWQEALLALALMLQNFDLSLDDPNYQMQVVQSLTIKPKDFFMRARLRGGVTATVLQRRLQSSSASELDNEKNAGALAAGDQDKGSEEQLVILYGSNTGTCQALAQKLATQAAQRGIHATVNDLDSAVSKLPQHEKPVVVITASYEGLPPDNAARFVAWLQSVKDEKAFNDVKYAVFGCGHSDWVSTYQRIPKLVDDLLDKHGAMRIAEIGSSDANKRETFGDFEAWTDDKLWPALSEHVAQAKDGAPAVAVPTIELTLSTDERAAHLQQNVQWANVVDARRLTAEGEPEKRHIEIQLPSNMTYTTGDYLAILPLNPEESIRRVTKHFCLPWDAVVTITKSGSTTLPINSPIKVAELLRGYVELGQPATRADIAVLLSKTTDPSTRAALKSLTDPDNYTTSVVPKRTTVLDLLIAHAPHIPLPFATYLSLLPPLRPRHYSISSSPLAPNTTGSNSNSNISSGSNPQTCTLTYSVLEGPSLSAPDTGFHGVASSYLRSLVPGDGVLVSVRATTNPHFRPPADPEAMPVVMAAAGAGLAPFRGFLQERAAAVRQGGRKLAPALLFLGCRGDGDRLYADEVDGWVRDGVVDVRYAFSRSSGAGGESDKGHLSSAGCRYVQDRMLKDREDIARMWDAGARFYLCGSKELAVGVGKVARRLIKEGKEERGEKVSEEEVEQFVRKIRNERFVTDVF